MERLKNMYIKLPCGLLCNFEPNGSDIIHVALVVRNGAFSDYILPGTAHFLEHMLMEFKFNKNLNNANIHINGTTIFDHTKFLLSCSVGIIEFKQVLEIAKSIAFGEYLNSDNINKVRSDINKEYTLISQNQLFSLYSMLICHASINPYMPIGTRQSIDNMKYSILLDSYKRGYALTNMQLCISGGILEWYSEIVEIFRYPGKLASKSVGHDNNNNYLYRVEDYYSNSTADCTICFFNSYVVTENFIYNDIIESIALTLFEEIIKKEIHVDDKKVIADIVQFSLLNKFVKITIKESFLNLNMRKHIDNLKNCLEEKSELNKIIDEIVVQYHFLLKKNEYGFQYIQHLIDCFVYNRTPYKNINILQYIDKNKVDLSRNVILYLRGMLSSDNWHLYKILGDKIIYEK